MGFNQKIYLLYSLPYISNQLISMNDIPTTSSIREALIRAAQSCSTVFDFEREQYFIHWSLDLNSRSKSSYTCCDIWLEIQKFFTEFTDGEVYFSIQMIMTNFVVECVNMIINEFKWKLNVVNANKNKKHGILSIHSRTNYLLNLNKISNVFGYDVVIMITQKILINLVFSLFFNANTHFDNETDRYTIRTSSLLSFCFLFLSD